jgi:uncharacterized protein YndB with AHSA1/START domain
VSRDLKFERLIDAPPEAVFDALASPEGQRELYGKDDPGWIVESRCDFQVGGIWSISFGPSPSELYRHEHVFEEIERPHRLRLATTEFRLDGSSFATATEFTFETRGEATLMTMSQAGFPTEELRDEHLVGVPHACERLARVVLGSGQ